MIDWNLGNIPRGLAVEGETDKMIIEAFLDAGEGNWSNWRSQVKIMPAGDKKKVINVQHNNPKIWGLIDKDGSSQKSIDDLQTLHPKLLVLPRWTIENYLIVPDELTNLIPTNSKNIDIYAELDKHKDEWLKYGALWHIFTQVGVFGNQRPNPTALCKIPMPDEIEIRSQLAFWSEQFNPDKILDEYKQYQQTFRANGLQNYTHYIHGKKFFLEIVHPILNRIQQKSENAWKEELLKRLTDCPADIVPILRRVVG